MFFSYTGQFYKEHNCWEFIDKYGARKSSKISWPGPRNQNKNSMKRANCLARAHISAARCVGICHLVYALCTVSNYLWSLFMPYAHRGSGGAVFYQRSTRLFYDQLQRNQMARQRIKNCQMLLPQLKFITPPKLSQKFDFQLLTTKLDNTYHSTVKTVQIWTLGWFPRQFYIL